MSKLSNREIFFNEELHKYTDEYNNVYISATQLIHKVEPIFDKKYWLMYSCLKESGYYLRPDLKNQCIIINNKSYSIEDLYKGKVGLKISIGELNLRWEVINKESCEKGTATHKFIEDEINIFSKTEEYKFNYIKSSENNLNISFKLKINTLKDLDKSCLKTVYSSIYECLRFHLLRGRTLYTEVRLYHPDYYIAGTVDLVIIYPDKTVYVIDWKTNKDELLFESGYFKKEGNIKTNKFIKTNNDFLKFPLSNIENCKGNLYTLQLSLYGYILEEWGFKLIGLELFHIRNGKEKSYKIKYLKNSIEKLFKFHLESLNLKIELNFNNNLKKVSNGIS